MTLPPFAAGALLCASLFGGMAHAQPQQIPLNCALAPSGGIGPEPQCDYPDATNTGVRAGVVLQAIPSQVTSGPGWHWDTRGWVTIDGDGTVFANYSTTANVDVTADNVNIHDVRIKVNGETFGISLRHTQNTHISYSEIGAPATGERLLVGVKDIYGDATGTDIRYSDIFRTSTGIQIYSGIIARNYIHAMGFKAGDHTNGVTSNGSTVLLKILHNTIFNQLGQTDAIGLFQDFGVEANRIIDDNLIAGGGYTLYAGQNPGAPAAYGIKVTNNRFSRLYFPNGGFYGPATAYNPTAMGNSWSGNFWDDTGDIIPAP